MNSIQQISSMLSGQIIDEWSNQLKTLLENKHLYQKVDVGIPKLRSDFMIRVNAGNAVHIIPAFDSWEFPPLEAAMTRGTAIIAPGNQQVNVQKYILHFTNAKLFCSHCESSEVFSPLVARDVSVECKDSRGNSMPRKNNFQLFFLAMQCQNCNSDPEGFIIRRDGYRLYLEGRSPIEHVDLPRYIPKKESHFFSDAVVAFNAGKKLAGLFYLRTFLEQFARRMTGIHGRATGDEIMTAYAEVLPATLRDQMPSLKEWYEKLSEALHDAKEDDELFQNAKQEIDRHFDMRRVFKIAEVDAPAREITREKRENKLTPEPAKDEENATSPK